MIPNVPALIAALPRDSVAIAKFLAEKGIRGLRDEEGCCPIARYLKSNGVIRCYVQRSLIEYYRFDDEQNSYRMQLSTEDRPEIDLFISMFDSGQCPELEM